MDQPDHLLAEVAARQHGTFTAAQAATCGLSRRSIDKRVARGLLVRVHASVYKVAGSRATWHQRLVAGVLSLDPPAAASHRTAAFLWDMLRRVDEMDVVTRRWDRRHRSALLVHESKDLIPEDVVEVDGVPVTSPVRTVVDLGAAAPGLVGIALDAGLRTGLFDVTDVRAFVGRVARSGRRGVGVIRPLLDERERWATVTESALEDRFRRLLEGAGFVQPTPQFVLRDAAGGFVCRADFAYPERRVLIEIDSEQFHLDRQSFHRDREKQNRALMLGWRTLRFTREDLDAFYDRVLPVLAYISAQ